MRHAVLNEPSEIDKYAWPRYYHDTIGNLFGIHQPDKNATSSSFNVVDVSRNNE